MAWQVKQVGYGIVDGYETLQLPRGFEPLHYPLSSSRGLMEVLGSIIQTLVHTVL